MCRAAESSLPLLPPRPRGRAGAPGPGPRGSAWGLDPRPLSFCQPGSSLGAQRAEPPATKPAGPRSLGGRRRWAIGQKRAGGRGLRASLQRVLRSRWAGGGTAGLWAWKSEVGGLVSRDQCAPADALRASGEAPGPCAERESAEMVNDRGQAHSPGGGGGDRAARQAIARRDPRRSRGSCSCCTGRPGPHVPPTGPPPCFRARRLEQAGSRLSPSVCSPGPRQAAHSVARLPARSGGRAVAPSVCPLRSALWGGHGGPPRRPGGREMAPPRAPGP